MEREIQQEPDQEPAAVPARPVPATSTPTDRVVQLQRTIGNRQTRRVLARDVELEAGEQTRTGSRITIGEAGEFELLSFSMGAHRRGDGSGGAGSGKVNLSEAAFSSYEGAHSAALMKMVMDATETTARVVMRGKEHKYEMTFSGAIVTSYSVGGSRGDKDMPVETWSINFKSVEHKQS